ncbi:hypothetical protein KORDIASMS9_02471 [Kordia sp. SMS9]|nr:hypothetical protein KORDIASMS9_02471 [Kordia sp. SMS9]
MMKLIKEYLLYFMAVLPQIFLEDYYIILLATVSIGFIAGYLIQSKKVFLKMMIIQLIVISILFYLHHDRIAYIETILQNLGLSLILIPVIFIVFNTLNIAILFFFGYKIQDLIASNHIQQE